jgi:hypothetical protein
VVSVAVVLAESRFFRNLKAVAFIMENQAVQPVGCVPDQFLVGFDDGNIMDTQKSGKG